jgi:cytochrome P450
MQDDEYNGWHIPGGATVIGNTWAIGRDPEYFPDGDDFRPERYMPGPERDKIMGALGKGHTSFGHGRRICPGLNLAERSLAVAIAQIFWAFDVNPVGLEHMVHSSL